MNLKDFLASGIIETYCLGFSSPEENLLVETMLEKYPQVQYEISEVRNSLEKVLKSAEIKPAASVKTAVMNSIYTQQAELQRKFVPLLDKVSDFKNIEASVLANKLEWPSHHFENLHVQELPSTNEIINFAVWVKKGHEEEMHTDRNEFIAVLQGSCDMVMGDERTAYGKGDIISIPINVPHYAVITSAEPMFALVQRQLIAN